MNRVTLGVQCSSQRALNSCRRTLEVEIVVRSTVIAAFQLSPVLQI